MRKLEALARYSNEIPPEILMGYKDEDKFQWYNDKDPDMQPIKLMLPKSPPWHLIDGFGLPAKDQKFKAPAKPRRLQELENDAARGLVHSATLNKNNPVTGQKLLEAINDRLSNRRHEYIDEILWIKKQQYHYEYGYWCFINGKPTYIAGWYYRFLTTWNMEEVGLPEYRDRDRRKFFFYYWAYTTTHDEKWVDRGLRTLFGVIYPKHRRDGATHNALCVLYAITSTRFDILGGIQSFDDDNARTHFQTKLIPAWQKMPFWVKPMWNGSNAPMNELSLSNPQNRVIGAQLGSRINFATTAKKSFYDGKKQYANLSDEEGKTLLEDIVERWRVVKLTLAQGAGAKIHGFSLHPSTVAEMDVGGGDKFFDLVNQSMFENRVNISGQTVSGLVTLFMRASDGLEGFIGPYGESVEDTPTPEQAEFIGRTYGSRQFIEDTLGAYLSMGTPEAMAQYRNFSLLHPQYLADCFRVTSGDTGFDYKALDEMITSHKKKMVMGDLDVAGKGNFYMELGNRLFSPKEWLVMLEGKKDLMGQVVFVPEDDGRWYVSEVLPPERANRLVMTDEGWAPEFPGKYTGGNDPFNFLKRGEAKINDDRGLSDGGCAIFKERDLSVDPMSKPVSEWETYRFVADYRARPDTDDEYYEESLWGYIYYGADIYPEVNIKGFWKHVENRGFSGMLLYGVDPISKEMNSTPGYSLTSGDKKQLLFNQLKKFIRLHVKRDKHVRIWQEARKIRGLDFLNKFDTLAAAGGCLLGSLEQAELSMSGGAKEEFNPFDIFKAKNFR